MAGQPPIYKVNFVFHCMVKVFIGIEFLCRHISSGFSSPFELHASCFSLPPLECPRGIIQFSCLGETKS